MGVGVEGGGVAVGAGGVVGAGWAGEFVGMGEATASAAVRGSSTGVVSVSPLEPQETASVKKRADRVAATANEVILMLTPLRWLRPS